MPKNWWRRWRQPRATPSDTTSDVLCAVPCATPCAEPCPLLALPAGARALVVRVGCPLADAGRLRVLGVFEGAHVGIVAHRSGLLLDVRGSRLALDATVAGAILALPLAS